MRTHVVLPDDLVREVDEQVGARKRSEFIEKAIRAQLRRDKQWDAIEKSFGVLKGRTPEYWSTPEKTTQWVHDLRKQELAMEDLRRRERTGTG